MPRNHAFTLIEMLIVVVILGILASVGLPAISNATTRSQVTAAAEGMVAISKAATRYQLDHGVYPSDRSGGDDVPDLAPYLHEFDWETTPIGGEWDWDNWTNVNLNKSMKICVSINRGDNAKAQAIDALIDDGNAKAGGVLTTGFSCHYVIVYR
ncbi:MAG: prepilin-type N-terminal cleavage/methylation domain-containing protein [Planctomycetota bacterium]